MGDTDGPSDAAQSALPDENTASPDDAASKTGGFFSRVIGALSPSEGDPSSEMTPLPVRSGLCARHDEPAADAGR